MRIILGILLLVVGVGYPMAGVVWLNHRMSRSPALTPRQVGLFLALNGVMPVCLIFWAMAMIMPRLWGALAFRLVCVFATVAVMIVLGALRRARSNGAGGNPVGKRPGMPPEEAPPEG